MLTAIRFATLSAEENIVLNSHRFRIVGKGEPPKQGYASFTQTFNDGKPIPDELELDDEGLVFLGKFHKSEIFKDACNVDILSDDRVDSYTFHRELMNCASDGKSFLLKSLDIVDSYYVLISGKRTPTEDWFEYVDLTH